MFQQVVLRSRPACFRGAGARTGRRFLGLWLLAAAAGGAAVLSALTSSGRAGPAAGAAAAPTLYRSKHFSLHTDSPPREARTLLDRLEATLRGAVRYWKRPPRGVIECYVAAHIEQWPDAALPHPMARIYIGGIGGATLWRRPPPGRRGSPSAVIFASARPGVAEHESVHAYCMQTFGHLGPAWYKEGMAEMAYYASLRGADDSELAKTAAFLRQSPVKSLDEVLEEKVYAARLAQALETIRAQCAQQYGPGWRAPLDLWTLEDAEVVEASRRSYRWAWALCRMLSQNPNYAERFRRLGQSYLAGGDDSFEKAFGAVKRRLAFEYGFFLRRIEPSFRIDLCSWDWTTPFRRAAIGQVAAATVEASRGYQASGLVLGEGESYAYRCEGAWRTGAEREATGGDGDAKGRGRLFGVLLEDFQLGRPFPLGASGRFRSPGSGRLYLRCNDDWGALADNQGRLIVRLRRESGSKEGG